MGSKRRPVYDIVAADGRYPRDGRFIEKIGQYNPVVNAQEIVLKRDRALYWLSNGAQPTDTVNSILRKEGVIMEYYLSRKGNSPDKIAEELASHKLRQDKKKTSIAKPIKVVAAPVVTEDPALKEVKAPVAEAPSVVEVVALVAEAPALEEVVAPVAEAPALEEVVAPVAEAPAVEEVVAPVAEAPAVEEAVAPVAEAPALEDVVAPVAETPAVEEVVAPLGEAPTQEA